MQAGQPAGSRSGTPSGLQGASAQVDQPRASSSGTASGPQPASAQSAEPSRAPVAFILGLAECARAVRDAAFLEPEACAKAAEAAEVPKWKDVPKVCGFKVELPRRCGKRHWATKEEKSQQCKEYRLYVTWARQACLLSEAEFKVQASAYRLLHSSRIGVEV